MAFKRKTSLGEDIGAAQMLRLGVPGFRVVICGLIAAQTEVAECKQVRGIQAAGLKGM
jgi:hypothetical protein